MKKLALAIFAAALALVSCNKQETAQPVRDLTVRFSTEKLADYTFKSALEAQDQVGVFAGVPINGVNVLYTATADKKLASASPLKWIADSQEPVDFTAYRPYDQAAASANISFAVRADQSAEGAYDASDLMVANALAVQPGSVVSLTFRHALSKIAVRLTNNVEGAVVTGVAISDVALGADVDLTSGAISNVGAKQSVKSVLAATQWEAIVIPQSARPMISVSLSNGLTYKYLLKAEADFAAGKVAVANLVLNPGQPSEEELVQFTFTVLDWEEGLELETDDPVITGEEAAVWKVVGIGGTEEAWHYENGIAMTATTTEGVWEAEITLAEGDSFKLFNGETWVGMKPNWGFYGLGDFSDGYLQADDDAKNIVVKENANTPVVGKVKLSFTWPSCRFIVTLAEPEEPETPAEIKWVVVGIGGTDEDWQYENGIAMTCTEEGDNPGEGVWEADITLAEGDTFKLLNNAETPVWVGMKSNWGYYGLGDFEDGYLQADDNAKNIVVKENADTPVTGKVHLVFTWPSCKFAITVVNSEP